MKNLLKSAAFALSGAFVLAGCVSPVAGPSGLYARPIGNAPVTANPTNYSKKLECMAQFGRSQGFRAPRVAVGRILDYTGKADGEGGRRVTQGGSLMAMSAFAKAGAHLVERFDTAVTELELKYANNQLIGGGGGISGVPRGAIAGSDFFLVGGITEVNYNIRSTGIDAFGGEQLGSSGTASTMGSFGAKMYVINVAIDLRLVDTKSLDVVDVISYQKQIIGREVSAGVFDFFGGNIFDLSAGTRAQEPIQLAIRATIERGVLELVANMYGAPGLDQCGAGRIKRGQSGYALQPAHTQYAPVASTNRAGTVLPYNRAY